MLTVIGENEDEKIRESNINARFSIDIRGTGFDFSQTKDGVTTNINDSVGGDSALKREIDEI